MSINFGNVFTIFINFNTLESKKIIDLYSVNINVNDPTDAYRIIYQETSLTKYFINNYTTIPQYFFTTYYQYPFDLTTKNFSINLPYGYYYYYDSISLAITIYAEFLYIPIVFLGAINSLNNIIIYIYANLKLINSTNSYNYKNTCTIPSFYFINKTVGIPGTSSFLISLNSFSSLKIDDNYGNYNNLNGVNIDNLLKIYNYDYSYCKIKNITIPIKNINNLLPSINVEAINFMIEILDNNGSIYYNYIVNLNYDLINYNDSNNVVIFFKNFIKNTLNNKIKLYVFDYDYYKYFNELTESDYDLVLPITLDTAILYNLLIGSNNNLLPPLIPDITIYNQNFNKIMIINNLFLNQNLDIISEFLKSSSSTIDLLSDYLSNFNIKSYNFWKITTNYSSNLNLDSNNFLLNTMLMNINIISNINNNLLYYNLYAELFNNNNKIDLYHKKYNLTSTNKKQLIKDFILIILNYLKINIYFYNDIEDFNKLNIINIKFNKFILSKSDSNLRFNFDQFYNLNITIDLPLSYKIIIFKIDIINEFEENILNFKYNNYIFQIFKIPIINGNIDTQNNIYYIVFSNISECNEFMNFITTGVLYVTENEITSFYNIEESLNFKKNNNNYYEITNDETNIINFSIINLDLLNGSIYTNNTINII
jgi:hypothetical protein